MILIVGGEGSGKRTFAETLGYSRDQMADGVLTDKPVVFHVEAMVEQNLDQADRLHQALREKEVVICNEVGSGIIPVDRNRRLGREATGRLCVLLAQEASCVVRMVCGIPTVIKGQLP